jgi:hypothetical protein
MRDEVPDFDAELLESWFERGVERSKFSGRLLCEELRDIGPSSVTFWGSLAFLLQRERLHSDAGDAWAIASEVCESNHELCSVLFAAAHSWWDVHLSQERVGNKSSAWEFARGSILRAVTLGERTEQAHQWLALLHEDVDEIDEMHRELATALKCSEGTPLDWSDFWFASESVFEISDYNSLLKSILARQNYHAAGMALSDALGFGFEVSD